MQTDSLFLCGEIGHKQIEIDIERKKEIRMQSHQSRPTVSHVQL